MSDSSALACQQGLGELLPFDWLGGVFSAMADTQAELLCGEGGSYSGPVVRRFAAVTRVTGGWADLRRRRDEASREKELGL